MSDNVNSRYELSPFPWRVVPTHDAGRIRIRIADARGETVAETSALSDAIHLVDAANLCAPDNSTHLIREHNALLTERHALRDMVRRLQGALTRELSAQPIEIEEHERYRRLAEEAIELLTRDYGK